jgi:hypothetical protein
LNLKAGERLAGLSIYVASGASSLRGRVVGSPEVAAVGAPSEAVSAVATSASRPLRVHLVPAEREQADNVLRYAESAVAPDGTFALTNLHPGRYWLLTRPAPDASDLPPRPLAHDADARSRLRRAAEASNVPLALAPCQRLSDFVLRRAAK